MLHKFILIVACLALFASCASRASSIAPASVSALEYKELSCAETKGLLKDKRESENDDDNEQSSESDNNSETNEDNETDGNGSETDTPNLQIDESTPDQKEDTQEQKEEDVIVIDDELSTDSLFQTLVKEKTLKELRLLCKTLHVPQNGKKEELAHRIAQEQTKNITTITCT